MAGSSKKRAASAARFLFLALIAATLNLFRQFQEHDVSLQGRSRDCEQLAVQNPGQFANSTQFEGARHSVFVKSCVVFFRFVYKHLDALASASGQRIHGPGILKSG